MKIRIISVILALFCIFPAKATVVGQWSVDFGQGIIEYSIYNDLDQKTYLTISDGSGELNGNVKIYFAVSGRGARPGSAVDFTVGSVSIRMFADRGGSISTDCNSCARNFDALWPLLRSGQNLRVTFDGVSANFTLRGSGRVLPRTPPVADFYR